MLENKLRWLRESYIFYGVLLINLLFIFSTKFYPSMDGPAHLYNSNLTYHLLQGNTSLSDFFIFNTVPIPNWISHFILSVSMFVFPAWIAEKILLCIYIAGLGISFRLLIKQLTPENPGLSILIFPFAYSLLFYLGFYNFSLSFILLFFTLYFFLKSRKQDAWKRFLILSLLLTLTYFSNILAFSFLGICLGLLTIIFELQPTAPFLTSEITQRIVKRLALLFLASLPGIVCLLIFLSSTNFGHNNTGGYTLTELTKWINDVRPLIIYDYQKDEILTEQFFHIIIIITVISLFIRFRATTKTFTGNLKPADAFLLPALLALVLFYIIPNEASAGMMSDRYCTFFFMILLIWVAAQSIPEFLGKVLIVVTILLHVSLLVQHRETIKNLNHAALTIEATADHIEENSIVLPLNLSGDWLRPHFSNYLGINKPLIILENYETAVGWFPVKWNYDKIPNVLLGSKGPVPETGWISNPASSNTKKIDYVFIYGNLSSLEDSKWSELRNILASEYSRTYSSEDGYTALYKLK